LISSIDQDWLPVPDEKNTEFNLENST